MKLLAVDAFFSLGWTDVIDILLVAFLIYQLYKIIKGTVAIKIFVGILAIYLLWQLFQALQMELVAEILGQFIGVGVIALIIVFQQELRRFLLVIGTTGLDRPMTRWFRGGKSAGSQYHVDIPEIKKACTRLSAGLTGALIIITRQSDLRLYASSAERVDGTLSHSMLESIFYKNSPLHDGAVIIANNRIMYARAVLPVTDREDFPIGLGTRHRAAAGITEISDAIAVVVSEQTGSLAYSREGQIYTQLTLEELSERLEADFGSTPTT